MKLRTVASCLLFTMLPCAIAPAAYAQSTDDATTKAARARFQEGVEHFDKGQFESARAAFLQAYALRKHPAVLLNLAQSSMRSGHALEAAKYFQQYLSEANAQPKQRAEAEKGLAETRTKIGRLEIVAPAGSEIWVDGDRIGNAPLREAIDVEPGSHDVKSRPEGGATDVLRVNATIGQVTPVRFSTQSAAPAGAPVPAASSSSPSAGTPPMAPPDGPLPPMDTPAAPAATPPSSDMGSTYEGGSRSAAPLYVGGTLMVAGITTAVVFALFKQNAQDSANNVEAQIRSHGGVDGTCTLTDSESVGTYGKACGALRDNLDKVDQDATIANIGLGVAAAGLVGGLVWYFAQSKSVDPSSSAQWLTPKVTPIVGSTVRGLSVSGAF